MTQATEKDIGKWCKFWDINDNVVGIDILSGITLIDEDDIYYAKNLARDSEYYKCTPLTQEQIKVLGLEE